MATVEEHTRSSDPEKAGSGSDNDHDLYHDADLKAAAKLPPGARPTDESEYNIKWTATRVIAVASLCIVYVGSQMILYFTDGGLTYIATSIHTDVQNWLLTANTLAVAAIAPFVGYITDLLGRKYVALFGTLLLLICSIIMGTAQNLGSGVVGMTIGGIGAGICELTALAGVAEITPVRWRGVTLSIVTFTILPFIPAVIYVLELQQSSTWRWAFLIVGIWSLVGLFGIFFCYKPPPRHNVDGLSKMEILGKIDYMGAFLSIGGITLFLVGLQAGGYQYPWTDGKVLGPLIVGLLMILAFPAWEIWGTKNPMVPGSIFKGQRVVALALAIVFIGGMDFYSILGFFPLMLEYEYAPTTATQVGIRALSYPFAILGGACIGSFLISYTNGHVRELFTISAVMMTAFVGALAAATTSNVGFALAMETLGSFGNGAIIVPSLTLALYACPDAYIGTTTALSLCTRFLGGSIGTAIYFNVFNTKLKAGLMNVAAAAVQNGLPKGEAVQFVTLFAGPNPAAATALKGVTQKVLAAATVAQAEAYAQALKYVWYTTIPFGIICVLCCLALPNIKSFMTNRVAVDIH